MSSNEFQGLIDTRAQLGVLVFIHYGHLLRKSAQLHDICLLGHLKLWILANFGLIFVLFWPKKVKTGMKFRTYPILLSI